VHGIAHRLHRGPACLLRGRPALDQPGLRPLQQLGAEQSLQQRPLDLGPGGEEAGELALRQQHGLHELGVGQPDRPGDLVLDVAEVVRDQLTAVDRVRAGQPVQVHGHVCRSGAGTSLLRPVVARRPPDPVPAALGLEDQLHHRLGAGRRMVGLQPFQHGRTLRRLAVQGEADGIQDGGLAGAGRALDQEQPGIAEPGQIQLGPLGERADGGHAQPV
jgi:hypothetical protein